MIAQPIDGGYLTMTQIAVLIGRTPRRVRQYADGQCGCEPLPADREPTRGCGGVGRLLTRAESFIAWQQDWERYPLRW